MKALVLAFLVVTASQDALKEAGERYARGDALGAADAYETAIKDGADNADAYFNLGTAALRGGDVGRAVWALMEARARAPWDEDILYNLELARRENQDTVGGEEESAWLSAMRFIPRAPLQWITYALFLVFCAMLLARGVVGAKRPLERATVRVGLFAVVLVLLTISVESTAGAPTGIVRAREAVVRSTERSDGPEAFRVHAGLVVRLVGTPRGGLVRIRLANGLEGFLDEESVRRVMGPPVLGR